MLEYEMFKDGVWVEPLKALLMRKTNPVCTVNHVNVDRKLIVEGFNAENNV